MSDERIGRAGGAEAITPPHYGVYRAIITEPDDPLQSGRVKLTIPQVFGDRELWALVALYTGANNAPAPLAKGDDVVVAFDAGDVREPIVIGRIWKRST